MKNYYCFLGNSLCKKILGAAIILFANNIYSQSNYVVTSNADSGPGSLREAITLANADPAKDNISFNIPGNGPHRIILISALPEITEPIVLDGTSQLDYTWETPQIVIDGNGQNIGGVVISGNSSGSTIKGLVIGGFLENNYPQGVGILAFNTDNHLIMGNYLGIAPDGFTPFANGSGIRLRNSSGNQIGGTNESERNLISGNSLQGIHIDGGNWSEYISTENVIIGNYIGTDAQGLNAVANRNGINIFNANGNFIGNNLNLSKNIIAGNWNDEIQIWGHRNEVKGNYVGVGIDGKSIPSNGTGIYINRRSTDAELSTGNKVGGSLPEFRNIIGGNETGILIESCLQTQIYGNYIGVGIDGSTPIPNSGTGLNDNGEETIIGAADINSRNIISGNGNHQIQAFGSKGKIQGNYIGTDISGTISFGNSGGLAIGGQNYLLGGTSSGEGNHITGNAYNEIWIYYAQNLEVYNNTIGFEASQTPVSASIRVDSGNNITIGGLESGMANRITGGVYGITVENSWDWAGYPMQVKISGNKIYNNSTSGIDILPIGINSNDPGDADSGHNRLQNFPVLTNNAALESGNINLSYFVDSAPGNSTYPIQVEFFIEAGNRQAKEYLFYDTFTEADYNAGVPKEISVPLPTGSSFVPGDFILSTATDAGGNTSEFGASVEVTGTCSGPVASCQDPFIIELGVNGTANLTVEEIDNGSTASCGLLSMIIDKTEFTCADIGDQVVTLSVTDINNTTVTCSTTVTVKDNILPELTTVLDKEVSLDESCQFMIPDYTNETTATDNCPNPIVTQTPAVGEILTGHNTTQQITLTADDGNGNKNSTSFIITIKDNTKPTLSQIADKEVALDENCKFLVPDYTTEVTVSDNCSTPTLVQSPDAGTELSGHGTIQEILITANDGNGNSNSTFFKLTLLDGVDPSISSVQDQTLTADQNCQATLDDYTTLVTVSDNCDPQLTLTQDPAAGTTISSETTVTLTVTDDAQNFASTTFTVFLEGGTTTTYYVDSDKDGYGVDNSLTNLQACSEPGSGYSTVDGDCDDSDSTIYPGAFDVRGDGIDQDCDGVDEPLDCIGTDRLDITQVCPESSTVETWVINNPSTCTVQVRWELKQSSLSGSLTANPGETYFNTPLTNNNRTMLTIYWNDKNGREKKSNVVSKGTECTPAGALMVTQSLSDEIERMVYPNPIADYGFWISFPPEVGDQTVHAAIYTLNGQILMEQYFEVPTGGGDFFWSFNHDSWEQGLYPLILTGSSQQLRTTLIK